MRSFRYRAQPSGPGFARQWLGVLRGGFGAAYAGLVEATTAPDGRVGRGALGTVAAALLVLGMVPPAMAGPGNPAKSASPITVTDFRGVRLSRARPVARVVCLIESATTAFYMLGAEQVLVGVSQQIYDASTFAWYRRLDPRVKNHELPVAGNWDFVNVESVLALKPDLVVVWASQRESIAALEERGIPVYAVFITREDDIYREVEAFGALTGRSERAHALVRYTERQVGEVERRLSSIPSERRPRAYYMWPSSDLETSCGGSTVNRLLTKAGAVNVCGSIPREHVTVNAEQLLLWNPDAIVMWHSDRRKPEEVRADPRWRTMRAIKTGMVLQLPEPFVSDLWTLKFQGSVRLLARWLHPGLFRDIDPARDQSAMLDALYGKRWGERS